MIESRTLWDEMRPQLGRGLIEQLPPQTTYSKNEYKLLSDLHSDLTAVRGCSIPMQQNMEQALVSETEQRVRVIV